MILLSRGSPQDLLPMHFVYLCYLLTLFVAIHARRSFSEDEDCQQPTGFEDVQAITLSADDGHFDGLRQEWISQFSAKAADIETAMSERLRGVYGENVSITATSGSLFDIAGFAADPSNGLSLQISPSSIIQRQFRPAPRRRQGAGSLATIPKFAVMQAAYRSDEAFEIVYGTWSEGFNSVEFYWIVKPTASIAEKQSADDNADALILAVAAWSRTLRQQIWSFQTPGIWRKDGELWQSVQSADWADIIMTQNLKNAIREDAQGFFRKEQKELKCANDPDKGLNVPFKRGIILHGPAGDGKTITLKALIKDADVPTLYVRTFTRFGSDQEGIKAIFEKARAEAPCMLILEDIDSLVNDPNRSAFLNEVDGMSSNDGILIVATTNHLDRLDGALKNRPSRFDRKYYIGDPNTTEREEYARYWQEKLKTRTALHFDENLIKSFAKETEDFSFAYLKETFVSTLLLIAGGDKRSFATILHAQIEALKTELRRADGISEALTVQVQPQTGFTQLAFPQQLH